MLGAKAMVGAGVGAAAGGASAFNADANNRQLHSIEIRIVREQATNFARQLKGADPSVKEIDAAEKRLADEAYRLVQLGAGGTTDTTAQAFLRSLPRTLLPGDSTVPGATLGYAFYAPLDQRANINMYADGVVNDAAVQSFYLKNRLALPSQAQVLAAINRAVSGQERVAALTKAAGLFAGGLTLAPMAPAAITACLANIQLCAISAAELAAGPALGPTGMGIGSVLAARAGVKGTLSYTEANAEWMAIKAGNTAAWPEGSVILKGEVGVRARMRMYVDADGAAKLANNDLSGLGGWATFDAQANSIFQVRQQLALPQQFKPTSKGVYVVELEVTKPMPANIGFVGSQAGGGVGAGEPAKYIGGGTQILLNDYLNRGAYVKVIASPKCIEGC